MSGFGNTGGHHAAFELFAIGFVFEGFFQHGLQVGKAGGKGIGFNSAGVEQAAQFGGQLKVLIEHAHAVFKACLVIGSIYFAYQFYPVFNFAFGGHAAAGQVHIGQYFVVPAELPGREGQVKSGYLGAAWVQLQAVQVFGNYFICCFFFAKAFFVHAQGGKHGKKRGYKMAGAHAGVEGGDFCGFIGPSFKLAGGGGTVFQ